MIKKFEQFINEGDFKEVKKIEKGDIIRPYTSHKRNEDTHFDEVVKSVSRWNNKVTCEDGRWYSISELEMLQMHGTIIIIKNKK